MNIKKSALSIVACAVFAASCTTDETVAGGSGSTTAGGEVTVSFTVKPEGRAVTREAESGNVWYPDTEAGEWAQISDGSKAHVLIYAVYDDRKQLLDQYATPLSEDVKEKLPENFTLGTGQSLLYIDEFPTKEPIHLRLMRNQTYHIAFWAQSADCEAYDTKDLQKVKVNYDGAANNDELRDAFCHTETFAVSGDEERNIVLVRPLAQINVGTAGYDFECAATEGDKTKFLYSKITLSGVSEYLDVVDNKVLSTAEDFENHNLTYENNGTKDITFGWARIPAYVNYGEGDDVMEFYPEAQFPAQQPGEEADYHKFKEQFLRVDLDSDGSYKPYVSWDEVKSSSQVQMPSPDTEIFKYLSMCYVLVPAHETVTDGSGEPSAYSTTLNSVTVSLATTEQGDNNVEIIKSLSNVPVQRNWRTNIIGKNMITDKYTAKIDIVPDYNGDENVLGYGDDEDVKQQ